MIEVGSEPLLDAALRVDERILQFLLGIPTVDERLEALIRPLHWNASPNNPDAFHDAALTDTTLAVATRWRQANPGQEPVLLIATFDSVRKSAFHAICQQAFRHPCVLDAADIPNHPAERDQLARLWTREAALNRSALLIQTGDWRRIPISALSFDWSNLRSPSRFHPGPAPNAWKVSAST